MGISHSRRHAWGVRSRTRIKRSRDGFHGGKRSGGAVRGKPATTASSSSVHCRYLAFRMRSKQEWATTFQRYPLRRDSPRNFPLRSNPSTSIYKSWRRSSHSPIRRRRKGKAARRSQSPTVAMASASPSRRSATSLRSSEFCPGVTEGIISAPRFVCK